MDDRRKKIIILAVVGVLLIGGIILWFILMMRNGDGNLQPGVGTNGGDWDRYRNWDGSGQNGYDPNGRNNGSLSGNGSGDWGNDYGNGTGWNGNGNGYGNGTGWNGMPDGYDIMDQWNGNGDGGYGNGDGWNGDSNSYGNGDGWNGDGDGGYGNGNGWNGNGNGWNGNGNGWNGNGNGGNGNGSGYGWDIDYYDPTLDAEYSSALGIFGDTSWDDYIAGLFKRISPDYAVDALNALQDEGVQLFIRSSELCGTDPDVEYEDLSPEAQQKWDAIKERVHTAKYLWQLEEIVLEYTLQNSIYRDSREYTEFQAYLEQNIVDKDEREKAFVNGYFYHIITDLEERMPAKALGYSWDEAMERVLLTAGDPLAEVVVRQEDYVPKDENGEPIVPIPDNPGIVVTVEQ